MCILHAATRSSGPNWYVKSPIASFLIRYTWKHPSFSQGLVVRLEKKHAALIFLSVIFSLALLSPLLWILHAIKIVVLGLRTSICHWSFSRQILHWPHHVHMDESFILSRFCCQRWDIVWVIWSGILWKRELAHLRHMFTLHIL